MFQSRSDNRLTAVSFCSAPSKSILNGFARQWGLSLATTPFLIDCRRRFAAFYNQWIRDFLHIWDQKYWKLGSLCTVLTKLLNHSDQIRRELDSMWRMTSSANCCLSVLLAPCQPESRGPFIARQDFQFIIRWKQLCTSIK